MLEKMEKNGKLLKTTLAVHKCLIRVILLLCTTALTICCLLVVLYRSCINANTLSETEGLTYARNGLPQVITFAVLFVLSAVFFHFCVGLSKRGTAKAIAAAAVLAAVLAMLWNRMNPYPAFADQRRIMDAVAQYGQGLYSDINKEYFDQYHNQMGFVVLISFLYRCFRTDVYAIVGVCNWLSVGGIVVGTALISRELFHDRSVMVLTAWLTAVFLPLLIYSHFCYGTLMSLCCIIHGFVWSAKYLKTHELRTAVISTALFSLAYLLYSGSLIGILAAAVVLFADLMPNSEGRLRRCPIRIVAFLMVLLVPILIENLTERDFCRKTEISVEEGIPASAYIAMGITSNDEVCPGAYDGTNIALYEQGGRNSDSANQKACEMIREALREFKEGRRDLTFFLRKLRYEWTDPWYSSLVMTTYKWSDTEISSPLFGWLVSEQVVTDAGVILSSYHLFIFLQAFLTHIGICIKLWNEPEKCNKGLLLIPVYFLGGFLFYLMWEAKPRYLLPYFVCLIPFGVYGSYRCCMKISKKLIH